ncbi:MAG: apolipoprotein N-acyltransferase [Acidobacteria bacterium]|nr:apolipoprotein N-acyltransferase [Acidobacteriota bacterium]
MRTFLSMLRYAFASALFLVLSFPGFSLWPMAWVALVPLLWGLTKCRGKLGGFFIGFWAGVLFFAGLLYWMPAAMIAYGRLSPLAAALVLLAACAVLAPFFGFFTLALHLAARRFGIRAYLLAPFAWVAAEFARNHLAVTGFPWGQLGVSQALVTPLIQIADLTGVYGVSFLVVAGNVVGFYLLRPDVGRRFKVALGAFLALGLFHVLLYAELRWFQYREPQGEPLKVAGIQGNILDPKDWMDAHWSIYPAMMDAALAQAPGSRVVILPENPVSMTFEDNPSYRDLMAGLARKHKVSLLFNGVHRIGEGQYGNSVFCMDENGRVTSVYDKIRLVPFAEFVPFEKVFFFAEAMSQEISHFTAGTTHRVHRPAGVPTGVNVCYEAVFPEESRTFTALGAQWLVNVTNDAWFGDTAAPWQHFQNSLVRAVENRRWLVRVANSGLSCIIDPMGRVREAVPLFQRGCLTGVIHPMTDRTVYVAVGDVFAWLCVAVTAAYLFLAFRKHGEPLPAPGLAEPETPGADEPGTGEPETGAPGGRVADGSPDRGSDPGTKTTEHAEHVE